MVGGHPGDVGREVHDVAEVQHERRLGHVHRGAVRRERVGDRANRILVLLEVLAGPSERGREGEVAGVVAGAPDGAGQDPREDQALVAADQQLRRRADQAGDRERPRALVPVGELVEHPSRVDPPRGRVPGGRGRGRPCRARRALIRSTARPTEPFQSSADSAPSANVTSSGGSASSDGPQQGDRRELGVVADRRDPPAVTAPADDDLRDHEHARLGRVVGERQRAEDHGSGTGLAHLVADHRVRHDLPPPRVGLLEPVGTRDLHAAARPQPTRPSRCRTHETSSSVAVLRQQREQRPGVGDRVGADDERRPAGCGRWRPRRSRGASTSRITLRRRPGDTASRDVTAAAPQLPP